VLSAVLLAASTLAAACSNESLDVTNPNNPDIATVYSSPRDVEAVVSRLYQQLHNGQYGSADDIWTQSMTMSFESSSQLGNFGMGTRGAIPRSPIDNSIGNGVATGNFRDFDFMIRNGRSASNAIAALDTFIAKNLSTGTAERDARARAFAYFSLGYAHGQVAMLYDSAYTLKPSEPYNPDAPLPLVGAPAVADWAIVALDSAIAISNRAGTLTIPADWTGGAAPMTMARFRQVANSYQARYRAGVARTPEERAAVDWNAVIADATAGIDSDHIVQISSTAGWSLAVLNQLRVSTGWSQMTPFLLGMADTSGGYKAWLATPLMQREAFLMHTPDQRFPSGATRAVQNTVSGGTTRSGPGVGSILYFRARPAGEDTPAEPWGTWYYDNHRFWAIGAGGGNGPFVAFARAEIDMLAAEGYLRTNQVALATPLIDRYRTRAGLPSVAGITDLTTPVPGGNACVPQVPQGPGFTTTACGNLFEAMKWEKRTETSFTGYAQWFIDSRGWGDLAEGTALEWPVPWQELFARGVPSYTTERRAARGTYGF
jgi:hypothetical protein